jgi:hypothetical protein
MRKIMLISVASLVAFGVAHEGALAMGGMGGPSDSWGSPYALYAPQTFEPPRSWGPLEGRSAYEGRVATPADCHGDRACEWRMRHGVHSTPAQ